MEEEKNNRMLKEVSIHAPARGATSQALCIIVAVPVSIHAPARGATGPPWSPLL